MKRNYISDQIAAALEGFFWPKFFFDWMTKNFDSAVKPVPILQTINLIIGIISLVYEWPLKYVAGTSIQQSMEVRLMWLPLASLSSLLLYQATNPALYYFIAIGVYFWAYTEGEVSSSYYHQLCSDLPWALKANVFAGDMCGPMDITAQDGSQTTGKGMR